MCVAVQFVAHPNCQQLIAARWYDGLPGYRRRNDVTRLLTMATIGLLHPLLCIFYTIWPCGAIGHFLRRPFVNCICHGASYLVFVCKLGGEGEVTPYSLLLYTPYTIFHINRMFNFASSFHHRRITEIRFYRLRDGTVRGCAAEKDGERCPGSSSHIRGVDYHGLRHWSAVTSLLCRFRSDWPLCGRRAF